MKNDFQPVVGHRFTFRAAPMPNWNGSGDCEVPVVEVDSQLSNSWGSLGLESVVTWTLTPTKDGTHVRMEHSGFRKPDMIAIADHVVYMGPFAGGKAAISSTRATSRGFKPRVH